MIEVLIIHRDLKLANIMMHFPDDNEKLLNMTKIQKRNYLKNIDLDQVNFQIKIADFGFSKQLKDKDELNKTICGTPLYMAPQLVEKYNYSYKADIWSIGAILFELINSNTPFHARNRTDFENKVEACIYSLN